MQVGKTTRLSEQQIERKVGQVVAFAKRQSIIGVVRESTGRGVKQILPEKTIVDEEQAGAVKNLDLWAFTSSRAKREFEREGKLEQVKKDIVEEVLERGDWTNQDRQYLEEVSQLLRRGAVEEKGSYWYCSPYPPTYRALKDGELLGRRFSFGQDITYQPAKNVDSDEKLIIGKFQTTTETESHSEHKTMSGRM